MEPTKIAVFRKKEIRKTIHNNQWWFVIRDVVAALTDSAQPEGLTLPHLLYHYELEYPALIDTASTGMPVENFPFSSLKNSSGVRYPSELCGLSLL